MTKFAVFYAGTTRVAKNQITAGFTLAACQALAGASGAALVDPRFTVLASPQSPQRARTRSKPPSIRAPRANGGTVVLSGKYTQSANLMLSSRVRLRSTAAATITFTSDAKVTRHCLQGCRA